MSSIINTLRNPIILIITIPTILVVLWFKEGNIMAMGEAGAPFYDPSLQFSINKDAWAQYTLGHPTNIGVAAKPTYFLLSLGQTIGIPAFLLQAVFFWLMLAVAGLSIYYLTREFFPNMPGNILLLAPFFYWFNPFSLVNIWNRFLNNFIVFYALLPLALFFFIRGIRTKQYKYGILIGLTSVIFSYALTSIAFDMLLWFVLIYTTLFYTVLYKGRNNFFAIKFFVFTLVFWSLANFWWIIQVFTYLWSGSFTAVTTTSFITENNYFTFYVLSERLGNLIDLLRLKHATFFADSEKIAWVTIYQFPLITILEFLVTGIIFLPVIFKRKQKEVLFLATLFLLAVFLAKGNNPPLGELFDKAFVNSSFLQVFRNPFEKIGFILPVAATPLFCLGIFLIMEKLPGNFSRIVYLVSLIWLSIVWGWPFWTSYVFTSTEIPTNKIEVGYQVKVPEYYKEAAEWLRSQKDNFRLIIFPISEEGITYIWPKGYSGVELSNQLLPATSVSFSTNIPFYDQVSKNLERIFFTKEDFSKTMDVLNSKYIAIRSDIDWQIRNTRDPQTVYNKMRILESSIDKFSNSKQFDELSFWQYSDWQDKIIYPANNLIKVSGSSKIEDVLQLGNLDVLYQSSDDSRAQDLIKSEIIHPNYKFSLGSIHTGLRFNFTDDLIFPAIRIFPSDRLYPLILFKERIELSLIRTKEEQLIKRISLLGKRLMEVKKELEKNNIERARVILLAYKSSLKEILPLLSDSNIEKYDKFLTQEEFYRVFNKQLDLINEFKTNFPEEKNIEEIDSILKEELINNGIFPYFGYIEKSNYPLKDRIIYQFSIAHSGNYEMLIDAKSWEKYFKISLNEPVLLQIDKELMFRKAISKKNYISFGMFHFDQGKHEIAWNSPEAVNLVEVPSEIEFRVNHGIDIKSFPINSFDPYSAHILSFNYFIKKGSGVEVVIEQNNDRYKKGVLDPQFIKYAGPDLYNFDVKQFSEYFIPSAGADSAKLVFKVKAWNNCKEAYKYKGSEKCNDEIVRSRFDLPTEILITNVSLVKIITEVPFLIEESNQESALSLPRLSYTKINGAEYKVRIEDAKNPFILVLSELFDPGWKVYSSPGREIGEAHFLANTYANGWLINETGTYGLTVKFMPQENLQKGEIVSILAVITGIIFLGRRFFLKYEKS